MASHPLQTPLVEALIARGVIVHAPAATVIEGVDPKRVEAGVEIFPGCTIRGAKTLLRAGTCLGKTGGGYFENVVTGRDVDLFGGYFVDAVFLDGVIVRGHAEMRAGTLMEEGSEVGHHVGYKMTITMPDVVAGSLVNFCDALVAGGTSRRDHSEIGSCLALYNFTPWGDKFASLFGDVPRGVFLRERRIFVGGQTQIVSPVKVGYGALIPAGAALRRSVPDGMMRAEHTPPIDVPFDQEMLGGLWPKVRLTVEYIANLWALVAWYEQVRIPFAGEDVMAREAYQAGLSQIRAGIAERVTRLHKLVGRVPRSLELHEAAARTTSTAQEADAETVHRRRAAEHKELLALWPAMGARLDERPPLLAVADLSPVVRALAAAREDGVKTFVEAVRALDSDVASAGADALQAIVDEVTQVAS